MSTTTVTTHCAPGTRSNCQKRRYWSLRQAEDAAVRELQREGFRGERVRIYGCKECHAYHLTTRPRSGKGEWFQRGQ